MPPHFTSPEVNNSVVIECLTEYEEDYGALETTSVESNNSVNASPQDNDTVESLSVPKGNATVADAISAECIF